MGGSDTSSRQPSDFAACRQLIRHGSHSFFMASLLLPKSVGVPATALYAFCRIADDLIDADQGGHQAVEDLNRRLDAIYAGQPEDHAEDRAMAEVVSEFSIPRAMPAALLEGLAWDTTDRRYDSLSELYDYAARVAGCVGAMMTLIMRTSDSRAVARALDLGVAMQLTNIARDIGEDAAMGRLYLPRSWFREADIDADAWLANPVADPRLQIMCRRLIDYANILYRRADAGVVLLPLSCRPGIRAARLIYSEIGGELARQNYDSLSKRAVVSRTRKTALLALAGMTTPFGNPERFRDQLEWPALIETRYLLDDIESVPYRSRLDWLLDLFESLDKRDRQSLRQQTQSND